MSSRRDFIKRFACAVCFCGFGNLISIAEETNKADSNNNETSEFEKNEAFALHWITELLSSLDDNNISEQQLRSIVKRTSQAHHDLLNVPEMVRPYIGKPDEFTKFLQEAWGWKVNDDKANRQLAIDENKPFCVCPLLKKSSGKLYPALCYCSEGFAEKMFSAVYQKDVDVTVAASVQRGDPSCVYLVKY